MATWEEEILQAVLRAGPPRPLKWYRAHLPWCSSFHKRRLFDGKDPHAPRYYHLPRPAQAGHFKIELIPGEFWVVRHQGLELTLRGASEKFEDPGSNELLL